MVDFAFADNNLVFTGALLLMIAVALMEGLATVLGAGFSQVIDALFPEADIDFDLDVDGSEVPSSGLSRLLGWLHVGKVPFLMLLVVFLTAFGLIGLTIQKALVVSFGFSLPWFAAVPLAWIASLPVVRVLGGIIAAIIPKEETDAVAESSFVGRTAVITLGTAKRGSPAQAKLVDVKGNTHYEMVEPDSASNEFRQGDIVLLTEKTELGFKAIANPNSKLTD